MVLKTLPFKSLVVCSVIATITATQSSTAFTQDSAPPIVKPGAPGEASSQISPEQSVALGQSRYTEADVSFMQNMIIHHQQAVDMVALIAERSTHAGVRQMGDRITRSQASEIKMMRTWLSRRGEALVPEGGAHMHHMHHGADGELSDEPAMTGMLSPKQMAELETLTGSAFDRMFLAGMIVHHQGAIFMVENLLQSPGAGEDPEISEFTAAVVADQSTEILRMQDMLTKEQQKAQTD